MIDGDIKNKVIAVRMIQEGNPDHIIKDRTGINGREARRLRKLYAEVAKDYDIQLDRTRE